MILVSLESLTDVATFEIWVHLRAGFFEWLRTRFLVVDFSGECHQRSDRVIILLDVFVDCQLPADCLNSTARDDHCFGFAVEQGSNQFSIVLDDDLNLLGDVVGVKSDPTHQALHRFAVEILSSLVF